MRRYEKGRDADIACAGVCSGWVDKCARVYAE